MFPDAGAHLNSDRFNRRPSYSRWEDVSKTEDIARYYALINIALGDTAIAAWDEKFYFQFLRPVTVIRSVQPKTDPLWYPLGAQVTNSEDGKNITPPFPAYPSGHASFGGALFGVLRQYAANTETFTFKFLSDEFNGKNKEAACDGVGSPFGRLCTRMIVIQMAKSIIDIAAPLGISVHDHIIVGKNGHASLKGMRLI